METVYQKNKPCIIEFQAFRDNNDKFIIKELVIFDVATQIPYSFIFKPPYSFKTCNDKSRRTNNWLSKHYHNISWSEGNIDYSECESLIKEQCNHFNTIFTTGTEKAQWLSTLTNCLVVDLKLPNCCRYIDVSPVCLNVINPKHKTSNCSLVKVYKLFFHLQQHSLLEMTVDGKRNGGGNVYLSGEATVIPSVQL